MTSSFRWSQLSSSCWAGLWARHRGPSSGGPELLWKFYRSLVTCSRTFGLSSSPFALTSWSQDECPDSFGGKGHICKESPLARKRDGVLPPQPVGAGEGGRVGCIPGPRVLPLSHWELVVAGSLVLPPGTNDPVDRKAWDPFPSSHFSCRLERNSLKQTEGAV